PQPAQPKFAPAPRPAAAGAKSISSTELAPTSPITRSPVRWSKENLKGLRRPKLQTCGAPPACGSIRRILPFKFAGFCALELFAASPTEGYRKPLLAYTRRTTVVL